MITDPAILLPETQRLLRESQEFTNALNERYQAIKESNDNFIAANNSLGETIALLGTAVDEHLHRIAELENLLSPLQQAAIEIWDADQEGREIPYSERLSNAIDALEPLLMENEK